MNSVDTIAVLNRLSVIHNRSLPTYLSYAEPWLSESNGAASATLDAIVQDHKNTVDRLGELILASGGTVDPGEFPMHFTGYHDLAFSFLLGKMIDGQRNIIETIEQSVGQLNLAPLAKSVAEESLGAAKGHLQNLLDLEAANAKS